MPAPPNQMENLSQRFANLSPEKLELLARKLRQRSEAAAHARAIARRRDPHAPCPLSYAQQRMWVLNQLKPESHAYNLTTAVRLTGELDVRALWRTLAEVERRHESLRTRFVERGGEPAQVVAPDVTLRMPLVDISALDPRAREAALRRLCEEQECRPFNLARGPVWRALLIRLGEREHALVAVMHHIVSDGWSMGVLVSEVAALYAAFSRGLASPLAELPIQYADYAAWQRERLGGEALAGQLDYWRKRLEGAPALELPTDGPRFVAASYGGAEQKFRVGAETAERVRTLSREEGATPFMVLLATFKLLLSRYTGQDDIVVGTNIANRNRGDIEPLVGFFVNNLVLRTDLSGDPSFRELIGRVRETSLGAYAHQDVPFETVAAALAPGREEARAPLFQVMFVLQNAPPPRPGAGSLTLSPITLDIREVNFELSLFMEETGAELTGHLLYATSLFSPSRIARMAEHFCRLLDAATAAPDSPAHSLTMTTAEQEQEALGGFNVALEELD